MSNIMWVIPGVLFKLVIYAVGFAMLYYVVKRAVIDAHREMEKEK